MKRRHEEGEIRSYLGGVGLLALMEDKIRRYCRGEGIDELIDLAADSLIALSHALLEEGYFDMLEKVESSLPRKAVHRREPEVDEEIDEPMSDNIEIVKVQKIQHHVGESTGETLHPCPKCGEDDVPAGVLTEHLPDNVCVACEEHLPFDVTDDTRMNVQAYLAWCQRGKDYE